MSSSKNTASAHNKIDFGEQVTVLVGEAEQKFFVHKSILCQSSDFFIAACSGRWQKGKSNTIRLLEHEPESFSVYLHWRYTGVVELRDSDVQLGSHETDGKTYIDAGGRWSTLINCYILGDIIGDRKFCNALVDCWFKLVKDTNTMPTTDANSIFLSLPATSKLSQLMADSLAFSLCAEDFADLCDTLNADVTRAVAKVAVKERNTAMNKKVPSCRDKCYYHEHVEGEDKCA